MTLSFDLYINASHLAFLIKVIKNTLILFINSNNQGLIQQFFTQMQKIIVKDS